VLLALQHCAHSRNRPLHGHGRENEKSLPCVGRDVSGWHTFWKIVKTVAARCHILKAKCAKFDFVWGSVPDHAGGPYSAPPDPLVGFKGPTSKWKEGRGREGEGRAGEGRGRKGRGGRGREGNCTAADPVKLQKLLKSHYFNEAFSIC